MNNKKPTLCCAGLWCWKFLWLQKSVHKRQVGTSTWLTSLLQRTGIVTATTKQCGVGHVRLILSLVLRKYVRHSPTTAIKASMYDSDVGRSGAGTNVQGTNFHKQASESILDSNTLTAKQPPEATSDKVRIWWRTSPAARTHRRRSWCSSRSQVRRCSCSRLGGWCTLASGSSAGDTSPGSGSLQTKKIKC